MKNNIADDTISLSEIEAWLKEPKHLLIVGLVGPNLKRLEIEMRGRVGCYVIRVHNPPEVAFRGNDLADAVEFFNNLKT